MKKIILCATQRCGSTMVCEDMINTGQLGQPREHFIGLMKANGEVRREAISKKVNKHIAEYGVFSAKVMANQAGHINTGLGGRAEDGEFSEFYHFFSDAVWVYIHRKDYIRQAISRVMARKTGICHSIEDANGDHFVGSLMKGYDPNYNSAAIYDFSVLKKHVGIIMRENVQWNMFFQKWSINPFVIEYENYQYDAHRYISEIGDKMMVDIPSLPERKLVRMSNQINDEWYTSFIKSICS